MGWEVHANDSSDHAVHLVRRTALAEGIAALADKPVFHGNNDSTLNATTVLSILEWLGVKPSYSRPRVSDDNAYGESLFRTAKHRPEFRVKGIAALEAARQWGAAFVHWYNAEHKHGGIRYVSPLQRHGGEDHAILAARRALHSAAKQSHRHVGQAAREIGSPSGPSHSIRNVTPSSPSTRWQTIFSRWQRDVDGCPETLFSGF